MHSLKSEWQKTGDNKMMVVQNIFSINVFEFDRKKAY